jgi:hypothetical protein
MNSGYLPGGTQLNQSLALKLFKYGCQRTSKPTVPTRKWEEKNGLLDYTSSLGLF